MRKSESYLLCKKHAGSRNREPIFSKIHLKSTLFSVIHPVAMRRITYIKQDLRAEYILFFILDLVFNKTQRPD